MNTSLGRAPSPDPHADWRVGAQALREGRPAQALAAFRRMVAAGAATAAVFIGMALAQKALGDPAGERAALDEALALEPRNLHALTMRADHHAAAGNGRAACAYYGAVVAVAAQAGAPGFEAEVERARRMQAHFAGLYEDHLRAALAGGLEAPQAHRARRALDLIVGQSQLYLQQPTALYFPELPNIQYAERADFPWLDAVEAATAEIRAELLTVLEEDAAFEPYIQAEPNRPVFEAHGMLGDPGWSAFYLWKGGEPVAGNIARCPATMAALEGAPLCRIEGRTPSILFSLLRPGAHIQPHHGFTNARYICHLPLIVPDGCAMRVGSDTRAWTEGEACVFDDSIEHEAWNRNPERLRVVMIFDVWRPELSGLERDLVSRTLRAVDSFGR